MTAAHDILTKAAGHMQDRASTYDKPEGERSMAQTVAIFNLYHDLGMTEAQGWHLLQILKDVRLFTWAGYHADSAEDCVAYAALKAEALHGAAMAAIDPALLGVGGVHALADWPNEQRRQDAEAEDEAFAVIEARKNAAIRQAMRDQEASEGMPQHAYTGHGGVMLCSTRCEAPNCECLP